MLYNNGCNNPHGYNTGKWTIFLCGGADYFSRYNLKETDYIRFHSQYGLIGVEAGGDNNRSFMVALDSQN